MRDAFTSSWASLGLRGFGLLVYGAGLLLVATQRPQQASWLLLPVLMSESLNALSLGVRTLPRTDEAAAPLVEGILAIVAAVSAVALSDSGGEILVGFLAAVAIANGAFQLASLRRIAPTLEPTRRRLQAGLAAVPLGSGLVLLVHPLVVEGAMDAVAAALLAIVVGLFDLRLGAGWRRLKRRSLRMARLQQFPHEAHRQHGAATPTQPAAG